MNYFDHLRQKSLKCFRKAKTSVINSTKIHYKSTSEYIANRFGSKLQQLNKRRENRCLPKKSIVITSIALSILLMAGLTISSEGFTVLNPEYEAYQVRIEGKDIGIVEDKEIIFDMIDEIELGLRDEYNEKIIVDQETLEFIKGSFSQREDPLTNLSYLRNEIYRTIEYSVQAFAIIVDGEKVAVLRTEDEAEKILNEIKEEYLEEEQEYEEVSFSETIEIQDVGVELHEIQEAEQVFNLMKRGTDEEKVHTIEAGDTISGIAAKYGLTVEEIEKANSDVKDIHRISIGDEISLVVPKPYVTVRTVEYVEMHEEIAFETTYNDTSNLYKGDQRITQQGKMGEKEITGYIIRENGRKVELEIKEEKILADPVTRIVARGTKERPRTVATGSYSLPTRGRLTSGFGMRWGRMHQGIDIAAPIGTAVNAADAGRVQFAGWRGSYGNLIIINHENGYQTYYAHLNSMNVKAGDRVFKGERIGGMGTTGNSTGSHLHFEVRRNGTPLNPRNFVNY